MTKMPSICATAGLLALAILTVGPTGAAETVVDRPQGSAGAADPRVTQLKALVDADVASPAMFDLGQRMNDMVFSFGEIGFQEFETQKYLGGLLREQGFTVEDGVAGIPTAWVARWGSGHPVIAFGSDIDGIPQGSQKPGVA